MRMPMQMGMVMYGLSNKINLMVMGHYMSCSMDMVHKMGSMSHNMTSTVMGLGDTRISALMNLLNGSNQQLIANIGLSLPTGSIENRADMHMNPHILKFI